MEDTKNLPTENAGIKVAEDSSKFRVAIWYVCSHLLLFKLVLSNAYQSGAGISGLALAALLSKQGDIFIDIYECNDEVRTAGAGIAFWKRFWTTLDSELDFDQVCLEMKTTAPGGWSTGKPERPFKAYITDKIPQSAPLLSLKPMMAPERQFPWRMLTTASSLTLVKVSFPPFFLC